MRKLKLLALALPLALAAPVQAGIFDCDTVCQPTTNCRMACVYGGHSTTCGHYGVCSGLPFAPSTAVETASIASRVATPAAQPVPARTAGRDHALPRR
jgi:hypothetical protein